MIGRISTAIDAFNDRLGRSVAWLSLAMVLVTALIVLMRYVFQTGSIALQESVTYLNALLFACGSGWTLKEGGHVRVDVLYSRLGPRPRARIDVVGAIVFLFPAALFIFVASLDYVALSWRIREASAESSGLPFVYLLKTTILLLALLLIVQGLSEALKSSKMCGPKPGD